MWGDQSGKRIYYHVRFLDNGQDWREANATVYSPVCVPADGTKFMRLGSAQDIQSCPRGWIRKPFYETYSARPNRRINLYN